MTDAAAGTVTYSKHVLRDIQVLEMLVRQPQLLLYLTPTLQSHMAHIKSSLGVSHEVAAVMVAAYPNLLAWSNAARDAKLSALRTLFRIVPLRCAELVAQHPKLLTFSRERLAASRAQLVEGLGVRESELAEVVERMPQLLLEPPATVRVRKCYYGGSLLTTCNFTGEVATRTCSLCGSGQHEAACMGR